MPEPTIISPSSNNIKINTNFSVDISNNVNNLTPEEFDNIIFSSSYTVVSNNITGTIDISSNIHYDDSSVLKAYIYKKEITATDIDNAASNPIKIDISYNFTVNKVSNSNRINYSIPADNFGTQLYLYLILLDQFVNRKYATFTFSNQGAATLTSITPMYGLINGSTPFTLTGTNLNTITAVKFGTNLATDITTTSTSINGKTPSVSSTGNVLIYLDGNNYNDISYNYDTFDNVANILIDNITFPVSLPTNTDGTSKVNVSSYDATTVYNSLSINNITEYFNIIDGVNNETDFLDYRRQLVNKLFTKVKTQYSTVAEPNGIIINNTDFPYSSKEVTGMSNNQFITKYELINYNKVNYKVIEFNYINIDDDTSKVLVDYLNNQNLASYVNMDDTDKNEFTYVFKNLLLNYSVESCTDVPLLSGLLGTTAASFLSNLYVKIDVKNETDIKYRLRVLVGLNNITDATQLQNDNFYIILNKGTGVNWNNIDSSNKHASADNYRLYDIIKFNNTSVTGSGWAVEETYIYSNSEYVEKQKLIKIAYNTRTEATAESYAISYEWNFMMGSIFAGPINASFDVFNNIELGIQGISPKPIILVERGNERSSSRQILRRVGSYNIDGKKPLKNKAILNRDSNERTRKLKLLSQSKTYNDSTFGGDNSNGSYTALLRSRH